MYLGVCIDTASTLVALCAVYAVARHPAALLSDSGPFQLKQASERARGDWVSHHDCPNTSSACTMTSAQTLAPEAATGPLVLIHMPDALRLFSPHPRSRDASPSYAPTPINSGQSSVPMIGEKKPAEVHKVSVPGGPSRIPDPTAHAMSSAARPTTWLVTGSVHAAFLFL